MVVKFHPRTTLASPVSRRNLDLENERRMPTPAHSFGEFSVPRLEEKRSPGHGGGEQSSALQGRIPERRRLGIKSVERAAALEDGAHKGRKATGDHNAHFDGQNKDRGTRLMGRACLRKGKVHLNSGAQAR